MGGKLGRLPNDPSKPRLKLRHFLTATDTPPASINWDAAVADWPMYANDVRSDCVFAMIGHAVEVWTANASTQVEVTDDDVLGMYSAVTGFDPSDPSTDQGAVIQDALDYWRKQGIAGHKILAFAEVDHTNEAEMQLAASLFGCVLLGINFPASAMDQFNNGQPWDVVKDDGGIEGGHAILGARYDQAEDQWYWITWGAEQQVTYDFIADYLEEAWVAASPEWVKATGSAPSGLDVAALNAAFTKMTGEPGPFQVGPNPPEPPVVPPLPSALDAAVQSLLSDRQVSAWVNRRHHGDNRHVARLIEAIFAAADES